jgi:hypothetical protein
MECSIPEWSSQLHCLESVKMHTICYFFNACVSVLRLMFFFDQELLSRQIAAEKQEKSVLKDLNRRIFAKFSAE